LFVVSVRGSPSETPMSGGGRSLWQARNVIAILSAPSNLGLRPPRRGSVPGTAKAPEALREAGLFRRLAQVGAIDAGVVLPGRYVDDDTTRPAGHVRNEAAMAEHSHRLADRLAGVIEAGNTPLVVGGDCSILLGIGLALSRCGRTGLVHVDGHTDFPAAESGSAPERWPALSSLVE
jgi:arginase